MRKLFSTSSLAEHIDTPGQKGLDGRSGVVFRELAAPTHLNLRCSQSNIEALTGISKLLGTELPLEPNTFHSTSDLQVYWLGPDEWLVISGRAAVRLEAKLRSILNDIHASITNISNGEVVIRVEGEKIRQLLRHGCSIDLHPNVFKVGYCAQTLLGGVHVLLARNDDFSERRSVFDIVIRRSFAHHLFNWLVDSSVEIGFINRLREK